MSIINELDKLLGSSGKKSRGNKKSGCLKRILTIVVTVLIIAFILNYLGFCDDSTSIEGLGTLMATPDALTDTVAGTAAPYATKPVATVPPEASPASAASPYATKPVPTIAQESSAPTATPEVSVARDGEYTSRDEVALYLHLYGKLPSNFITKSQAEDLGWSSSKGNLDEVAPGKSIGGSRFGNYEGLLPDGHKYYECDINYSSGYRGGERIVYSTDGLIFYSGDHYKSFTQLY